MSFIVVVTTLDDAYRSLNLAVGLPENLTGRDQAQFCLRIAVILGWVSVEEGAKHEMRAWRKRGFHGVAPRLLGERICLIAALRKYVDEIYREESERSGRVFVRRSGDDTIRRALEADAPIQERAGIESNFFDKVEFKVQRKVRNDILHVNVDRILTIAEGKECLEYCTRLIAFLSGHKVITNRY